MPVRLEGRFAGNDPPPHFRRGSDKGCLAFEDCAVKQPSFQSIIQPLQPGLQPSFQWRGLGGQEGIFQ